MQKHSEFKDELSHNYYRERQKFEISTPAIVSRVQEVAPAGRYSNVNNVWRPAPYPGFAFVAMVNESNCAQGLSEELLGLQKMLLTILDSPDTYVALPPESFHQTIANTFSADRYEKQIKSAGLDEAFPLMVHSALNKYLHELRSGAVKLKLIGLALFRTAIVILADIESEKEYDHILTIRNCLYSNKELNDIGLVRTRPFIGHITLAYIENPLDTPAKSLLVSALQKVNKQLIDTNFVFTLSNAELRKYNHLSEFSAIDILPPFSF